MHRNTISNHMRTEGIQGSRQRCCSMSDEELKDLVIQLNIQFLNSGSEEILAHLRSRSPVLVQRQRVRRILSEI